MSYRLIGLAGLLSASFLGPAPTALTAQNRDGQSQFAMLDGARVHYQSWGKGNEALVLIHGWTCNLDNWRDQIPDLSQRARVVALDLPGHGQSDKPEVTYSMDYFARAVRAVMAAAEIQRAVLVGHSMGTPIARQFYRKYPNQTLGIVIVDGALQSFFGKPQMDSLLAGLRSPAYQDVAGGMLEMLAGPTASPELKERVRTSFLNTPQRVLVSAMQAMADSSIWTPDPITVPVLAILAGSPLWPPDIEQRDHLIAKKLEFQLWDGVGHFLMMEQPKRFNDAVTAFLDKNGLLKR